MRNSGRSRVKALITNRGGRLKSVKKCLVAVVVQGCRIGVGAAGEAWRLATRSSGRAAGVQGCCSIVLFCPEYSIVTAGVTNFSKRECYIRSRNTPRLGFGSLLLHKLLDTQVWLYSG